MSRSKRIAVSWLELLLVAILVLAGLGLRKAVESWADVGLKEDPPPEFFLRLSAGIPPLERAITQRQVELKVLDEQIARERLALLIEAGTVQALETQNPGLLSPDEAQQVDEGIRKAYDDAREGVRSREENLHRLVNRSQELGKQIDELRSTLLQAERRLSLETDLIAKNHQRHRHRVEAGLTTVAFLLFLLLVVGAVEVSRRLWSVKIRRGWLFLGAGLTLGFILLVHFLGALGGGAVAMLLAVPLLLRSAGFGRQGPADGFSDI